MGQTQSDSEAPFSEPGAVQSHTPNYSGSSNHLVPYHSDFRLQQNISNNEYLRLPPFLNNNMTLDYIHISKVMFVMRGLAASGRPIVVQHIQSVFRDAVVCTTSEYFKKCER
jgi:hypothetical protein